MRNTYRVIHIFNYQFNLNSIHLYQTYVVYINRVSRHVIIKTEYIERKFYMHSNSEFLEYYSTHQYK